MHLQSISHRFVFDEIFKYATQQLPPSDIPVIERIRLGDKYGLRDWLLSAYQTLLDRAEPLKAEEADILGTDRVIRFIRAKEEMHQERLSIAKEEMQRQLSRAIYAEQYLQSLVGRYYHGGYSWGVPLSRTPTSIDLVVKKHFPDTLEPTGTTDCP